MQVRHEPAPEAGRGGPGVGRALQRGAGLLPALPADRRLAPPPRRAEALPRVCAGDDPGISLMGPEPVIITVIV